MVGNPADLSQVLVVTLPECEAYLSLYSHVTFALLGNLTFLEIKGSRTLKGFILEHFDMYRGDIFLVHL